VRIFRQLTVGSTPQPFKAPHGSVISIARTGRIFQPDNTLGNESHQPSQCEHSSSVSPSGSDYELDLNIDPTPKSDVIFDLGRRVFGFGVVPSRAGVFLAVHIRCRR
jgi:hypothetical protein